jgi:hypothetical protein
MLQLCVRLSGIAVALYWGALLYPVGPARASDGFGGAEGPPQLSRKLLGPPRRGKMPLNGLPGRKLEFLDSRRSRGIV